MKAITIEIDLHDIFMEDDEESLHESLKNSISNSVFQKVSRSIEDKVNEKLIESITDLMNDKMETIIDVHINSFIENGTLRRMSYSPKEVSIKDYLYNVFSENSGWDNPGKQLQAMADKLGKEMKIQLEGEFAQKIVSNMKTQGLLKDEVVNALMSDDIKPS